MNRLTIIRQFRVIRDTSNINVFQKYFKEFLNDDIILGCDPLYKRSYMKDGYDFQITFLLLIYKNLSILELEQAIYALSVHLQQSDVSNSTKYQILKFFNRVIVYLNSTERNENGILTTSLEPTL